jgi:hypothetical protein
MFLSFVYVVCTFYPGAPKAALGSIKTAGKPLN